MEDLDGEINLNAEKKKKKMKMRWSFLLVCLLLHLGLTYSEILKPHHSIPWDEPNEFIKKSDTHKPQTQLRDIPIPSEWQVLGPFPVGTRESGDSLEAYGGITKIGKDMLERKKRGERVDDEMYASEYAFGGYTTWMSVLASDEASVGPIVYDDEEKFGWSIIRGFYGWAANQWQGWAVSSIEVPSGGNYAVRCSHTSDFYLNDNHFFGDLYGYGNSWTLVNLPSGNYTFSFFLLFIC